MTVLFPSLNIGLVNVSIKTIDSLKWVSNDT